MAFILNTDWSPYDNSLIVSGGKDGKVIVWKIDKSAVSAHWASKDFESV